MQFNINAADAAKIRLYATATVTIYSQYGNMMSTVAGMLRQARENTLASEATEDMLFCLASIAYGGHVFTLKCDRDYYYVTDTFRGERDTLLFGTCWSDFGDARMCDLVVYLCETTVQTPVRHQSGKVICWDDAHPTEQRAGHVA